jgi:hypothetical protein
MALIFYYLRIAFTGLFSKKRSGAEYSLMLLFGVIFLGYTGALAYFIDHAENADLFHKIILGNVVILPVLISYTFAFESLKQWVQPFFPVSSVKRYTLHLIQEWVTETPLFLLLWGVCFTLLSKQIEWQFGIKVIVALQLGLLIKRCIHALFELQPKLTIKGVLLLSIAAFLCAGPFTLFPYSYTQLGVADLLIFAGATLAGFAIEEALFKPLNAEKAAHGRQLNLSMSLMLLKKGFAPLAIGIVMKSIVFFAFTSMKEEGNDANLTVFFYLCSTPIIIFTYVFNNSWGYFRNFWFLSEISQGGAWQMFKKHWQLVKIPMLIEAVIVMVFLAFNQELFLKGIMLFIISGFLLTSLSFFWSVYAPVYVKSSLSFKSNTSVIGNLSLMLILTSMVFLEKVSVYYYIMPVYLLIGIGILFLTLKIYEQKKEALFLTLYKGS